MATDFRGSFLPRGACSRNIAPPVSNRCPPPASRIPASPISSASANAPALRPVPDTSRPVQRLLFAAASTRRRFPREESAAAATPWIFPPSFQILAGKDHRRHAKHNRAIQGRVQRVVKNKASGDCPPVRRGAHHVVIFKIWQQIGKYREELLRERAHPRQLQAAQLRHEEARHVQSASK